MLVEIRTLSTVTRDVDLSGSTAQTAWLKSKGGVVFAVVPMTIADLPAVLEIERDSQPEPWSSKFFREEMERTHSHTLVARLHEGPNDLVGYLCFWQVADEIQILNIAVKRSCRRLGIGRILLRYALLHGLHRDARSAVLEVRRNNVAARNFYENMGFRSIAVRPNYYAGGEDAIIMEFHFRSDEQVPFPRGENEECR
jgi:[ribosomal protein S18]-alanine N-acetyltransferase